MRLGVIGAGLAGLACARRLNAAGHLVQVFDKGRGPGGRLSTRRAETDLGQVRFDHGAQYVTAETDGFQAELRGMIDHEAAAPYKARLVRMDGGEIKRMPAKNRFIGVPGMNALVRDLATDLDVTWGKRATAIVGDPWARRIKFEDGGEAGPFEAIIVAVPAEQVADLVRPLAPQIATEAEAARSSPTWALMAVFDQDVDPGFDGAQLEGPTLSWIARERVKPGRADIEAWTAHAHPDWSKAHVEDDAEAVAQALSEALQTIIQAPKPVYAKAHRWRYARVETTASSDFAFDEDAHLGVCGDWRIGAKAEAAWRSGDALGAHLNERLALLASSA